jgi:hypothetical protein
MLTPSQFEAISTLPDVPTRTRGDILLSNGREMIGRLALYSTIGVVDFLDDGGTRWFIDLGSVVAFSPRREVVTPLEAADAQNTGGPPQGNSTSAP